MWGKLATTSTLAPARALRQTSTNNIQRMQRILQPQEQSTHNMVDPKPKGNFHTL